MHHYITGEILASLMVKWMTGIFQQLWHESIWSLFLKSEILTTLVIVFQLYCSIFSLLCFGCGDLNPNYCLSSSVYAENIYLLQYIQLFQNLSQLYAAF